MKPTRSPRPRSPGLPPLPADSLALQLRVAAEALARVTDGEALNDGLASLWRTYPDLPESARGGVQDLVFGTLRNYGRAEPILARLLRTPPTSTEVIGLLRLALHRLETRPEIAHTVVDQAVEAAARMAGGNFKGLVNGVLRNALRDWSTLLAACDADDVASHRHPAWWLDKLRAQHPEQWREIVAAGNSHPPMSLRINRLRSTRDTVAGLLGQAGHATEALGEHALHMLQPAPIASLPGYAEGLFSVQDWGAQQAAALLDLRDGQRVLDACAAPGGKTTHILECAGVDLLALDAEAARTTRITQQLERLGLHAQVRTADARTRAAWWDGRPFERILADVPCSASGVVRRHPDIKWLRQPHDVAQFATLQGQILDALWPTLAVGGKMLYVTCSIFAEENGEQIARFLRRHPDGAIVPMADGTNAQHWLPGPLHDGFYFALLQKQP